MHTFTTENFTIETNGDRAYFEHLELGDKYAAALCFDLRRLVDYSGVSVIPREVIEALTARGYDLTNA